ncbi:unnamed protein product [Brachionus calyciflorus]|uniref:JmjC domain-containing protein n=1 Tax=Brachionus calyciflorus TaxID=104777 RepID=A0A813VAB8_9BILA|nr:unnamed protein product [Brachionus calyciflorus]
MKSYRNKIFLMIVFLSTSQFGTNLLDTENSLDNLDKDYNSYIKEIEEGPCNIPIVTEPISQREFLDKYAFTSPVIFRFSEQITSKNKLFQEKCQLENLKTYYGDKYVTVSSANTYSYKRYSMKLNDYLDQHIIPLSKKNVRPELKYGNETWYFFGENNFTEWKSLFDLYQKPNYWLPKHTHAYSFGIAAFYTGVPFHFHGPVFAETMVGRKRWFLYEPNQAPYFDPDKSTLHWFLEEYPKLPPNKKPYECILGPLEVIYFPDKWMHATLNVDNVVFISTFLSP